MTVPTMPFGKHKGKSFDEVPTGYFDWLLKQDWLQPQLREEIKSYLEDDGGEGTFDFESEGPRETPRLGFTEEELADLRRVLGTGLRTLVTQRSPDIGDVARKRLEKLAAKLRQNGLMEEIE